MSAPIYFELVLNKCFLIVVWERYIAWGESFGIHQSKDALQHCHHSYQKGKSRKVSVDTEGSSLLHKTSPHF